MINRKKLTKVQLEEKVLDLENKWKRVLADYLNLEKRIKKEKEAWARLANAQLLDKILPVLDELEICHNNLKDKGLTMVMAKFQAVLETEGVEEIKAKGKKFDPETMDAVEVVGGPKNKVAEVVLKGYRLGDRVLHPAKVKVGKG